MKTLILFSLISLPLMMFGQAEKPAPFAFQLNFTQTRNSILQSPKISTGSNVTSQIISRGIKISLPNPNGKYIEFGALEEDILSESLKKQYPDIHSYKIIAIDDPSIVGSVTISNQTLKASFNILEGLVIIYEGSQEYFSVFDDSKFDGIKCNVEDTHQIKDPTVKNFGANFTNGSTLKTYKLALLATGEFYVNNGGNMTSAMTAMTALVGGLNTVYEASVGIRFTLVSPKIYTDPATDPFDPNSTTVDRTFQSGLAFNSLRISDPTNFGMDKYDIGHSIHHSTSSGVVGVAQPSAVCNPTIYSNAGVFKAAAWSRVLPTDYFTFYHEVAHQFSALHTFNSVSNACGSPNQFQALGAFEPGSGSTIMSYWGSCSPDNISGNFIPTYFHTKTLEQIITFSTNTATCFTSVNTGNTPPVVNGNPNNISLSIPKGTPFTLTGSGTDANNDPIQFNWEQIDLGTTRGGAAAAAGTTDSPIFRSVSPSTTGNIRTFPVLSTILNNANTANNDEALPTVARTINMRLTSRDNRINGGGVNTTDVAVNVVNSGPFLITSQNTPTLWLTNGTNTATITWSVNGTNVAPLSVANVKISLSTDGGNTFPITLSASTPNDGSETIIIPNNPTTQGRIKIEPVGAFAFFDINNVNITISTTCNPEISNITPTNAVSAQVGNSALNLGLSGYGSAITAFSGSIDNTDPQTQMVFSNAGSCSSGNTPNYDIYVFRVINDGSYTFTKTAGSLGIYVMNIYSGIYSSSNPCNNWVASSGTFVSPNVSLGSSVTATLNAGLYYLVISGFNSASNSFGTYTVTSSGGTIYNPVPSSTSPYTYTYPVVNSAGNIVAFNDNSDLTSTTTYPSDVYTVYGLSYQGGLSLSSYVGTSFSSFQTLLNNNTVCGRLSTNSKTVTINCITAPVQPSAFTTSSTMVCQGQNAVTYTVPVVAGATSYSWSYSGAGASFSSTTNSVSINFSSIATNGTLSVTANNACGSSTARTLVVTVNPLPTQPSAFTAAPTIVCQGQNAVTYTVPVVAGATSYTWTYSGTGVPTTSTSNSITLNFSSTATSGVLSVVANNACGSSSPRIVNINVNQPPTATLSGTTTITAGQTANLSVSLTGTNPWSVVVAGTSYSSITASPYLIPVNPNVTTTYALTSVGNACGTVNVTTNNTATVTVNPQTITTSITGTTFCAGTTVTGTYTTGGSFNAGNVFTAQLSNASGSFASPVSLGTVSGGVISVTIPSNTPAGSGYRIRVVSSNPVVTGNDNGTNLTINVPPTATLSGTTTITAGQNANLSVNLTGTNPWSIVVAGTTYSSITASPYFIPVNPNVTTTYALTSVGNACGTVNVTTNNTATVTVNPQTITTSITGTTFCAGTTVTGTYTTGGSFNAGNVFTAQLSDASGSFTSPISLGTVSGGTISVTIPINTPAGSGYRIRVVSSNPVINGTANTANLTINTPPTASLSGTTTITAGQTTNLSVSLTGTNPWSIVVAGTTYSSITASPYFIPVNPNVTTTYALTSVSNACGTVNVTTNNTATVTVNPQTITTSITGTTFCAGTTVTGTYTTAGSFNAGNIFTAQLSDASGSFTSPISLGTVSGGTISVTIPINTPAGSGYRIRVVSSNPVINGTANTANLTISVPPTASLSGTATITTGQSTNLSVSLTGTNPWSIVVAGTTYSSITASPYLIPVNPNVTTTYALTSVSNACGTFNITTNNTAMVTVNPQTIATSITGSTAFCSGQFVDVGFTSNGIFSSGNTFTAQLSDAAGSFTSPINIGTLTSSAISGTITGLIPNNTTTGAAYRIRVIASNPLVNGSDNGTNLKITTMPTATVTPVGPVNLPSGGSVTLSTNTGTNFTYQWQLNNTNISGANSATYNVTQVGSYSVVIGVSGALCFAISNTVVVDVAIACNNDIMPTLVSNTNTICPGEKVVLRVIDAPFGYTYNWTHNNTTISSANQPMLVADQSGIYQANLSTGWYQVEPNPTIEHINRIEFVNDKNGWAVGGRGSVLKTLDGGTTWENIFVNTIQTFRDIKFRTSNEGWMVGSSGNVFKTTDGGVSWNKFDVNSQSYNWNSIEFLGTNYGMIVGDNGRVRVTNDGGITWSINNYAQQLYLEDVVILSNNSVFVVGSGGNILKTVDGGINWSTIPSGTTRDLKKIVFVTPDIGWIIGSNGTLLKTTNGGQTWASINTGFNLGFWDIQIKKSVIWISSIENKLIKSVDGGLTFSLVQYFYPNIGISGHASSIYTFKNNNSIISYGAWGTINKSDDEGNTWAQINTGNSHTLYQVEYLDNDNLIAVGTNSTIYKSNNRGKNWQKINSTGLSSNTWLKSLYFLTPMQGFAVDYYGSIYKTYDAGTTWSQQREGQSNEFLRDISFIDSNKGIAVGGNGLFLETLNGGATWSIRNIGFNATWFESIVFTDVNNGWITGDNGTILKTSDGGQTWTAQNSTITLPIAKSFFINNSLGWAVSNNFGGNNQVLKTTNGGVTWSVTSTIQNRTLEDVFFTNQNEGYITGIFGYIGKTTDGGNTWIDVNTSVKTLNTLRSIAVNSQGTGIIVGDYGLIYRFNPNACSVSTNPVNISNTISTGSAILSGTTSISPFTFQSGVSINSTQSITEGFNIEYKAKDVIDLQAGFDVKPQTFFKAELKGCNN